MTEQDKIKVRQLIREAVANERTRIAQIFRQADMEYGWDSYRGSRPNFSMAMVAIAEKIETYDLP